MAAQNLIDWREFCRINHDVFYFLSPPGVGDMDAAIGTLNHRGIGILARQRFESQGFGPFHAVRGQGDVQRGSPRFGVVINKQSSTILQPNCIDSGAGIREVGKRDI